MRQALIGGLVGGLVVVVLFTAFMPDNDPTVIMDSGPTDPLHTQSNPAPTRWVTDYVISTVPPMDFKLPTTAPMDFKIPTLEPIRTYRCYNPQTGSYETRMFPC